MTDQYEKLMEYMLRSSTGIRQENKSLMKMYNEIITICGGHSGVGPEQSLIALSFLSSFVAPFFASFPEETRRDIARIWLRETLKTSKDFISQKQRPV